MQDEKQISKKYLYIFIILTSIFFVRVFLQITQFFFNVDFLPSFGTWQSGVLPYGILIVLQLIILGLSLWTIFNFKKGGPKPIRSKGKAYLIIGVAYALIMIYRLVAGMTFAKDHYWLDARLPTIFHLILASIVITLGAYHFRFGQK